MSSLIEKERAEIEEKVMIHTALEEAGALPKHHAIHHATSKSHSIESDFWFYSIGYSIIILEFFYLYRII